MMNSLTLPRLSASEAQALNAMPVVTSAVHAFLLIGLFVLVWFGCAQVNGTGGGLTFREVPLCSLFFSYYKDLRK